MILFNRRAFWGSFWEAVNALPEDARIEIVLTEEAQRSAAAAAPVEIEASANTSLASSLDQLCGERRLRWAARDGRVTIEPRPATRGDAVTRAVYDVRDLVAKRDNYPGHLPTVSILADIGGPGVSFILSEPEEPPLSSDDLITLITEEVDRDVWAEVERHGITLTFNQNLFAKAPVSTQEKVAAYLQQLRGLRDPKPRAGLGPRFAARRGRQYPRHVHSGGVGVFPRPDHASAIGGDPGRGKILRLFRPASLLDLLHRPPARHRLGAGRPTRDALDRRGNLHRCPGDRRRGEHEGRDENWDQQTSRHRKTAHRKRRDRATPGGAGDRSNDAKSDERAANHHPSVRRIRGGSQTLLVVGVWDRVVR